MYATIDDYVRLGYEEIDDKTEIYLERASRQVNMICFGRIEGYGFNNLTEHQKSLIKEAVCCHANFINEFKDYLNLPLSSFSISKTSMNFGDIGVSISGVRTSKEVVEYLRGTGLTCRVLR